MSSHVMKLWQGVLDKLSSMCSGAAAAADTSCGEPPHGDGSGLSELSRMPPLPTTTWAALIQDLQLPHQLGLLASSAAAVHPNAAAGTKMTIALAGTMVVLVGRMREAGISHKGALNKLRPPVLQQLHDSGFVTALQFLMEVTAEQLERCTAAAAAAPAVDSGASQSAAAAAASAGSSGSGSGSGNGSGSGSVPLHAASATSSSTEAADCLEELQSAASMLLNAFMSVTKYLSEDRNALCASLLSSIAAAATHLMVAAMQHISVMLQQQQQEQQQHQQQQQQQQQYSPLNGLASLAVLVARSTVFQAFAVSLERNSPDLPQQLLGWGPHVTVWSDVTLVLSTYASIIQQQGQLPAFADSVGGLAASGSSQERGTATTAAAAIDVCSSGSSSASSGNSRQQHEQPETPPTSGPLSEYMPIARASAAWQEVQGQCDRIPASHEQLLQLLGVSPQAALWLAAIITKLDAVCPPPTYCWQWNPHHVATAIDAVFEFPSLGSQARFVHHGLSTSASVLQHWQQLKHWDDAPLRELLLLPLLYWAAHAVPGNAEFIEDGFDALTAVRCTISRRIEPRPKYGPLVQQQMGPALSQQQGDGALAAPSLPPSSLGELLLLTLQLLQHLPTTASPSSNEASRATATAGQRTTPTAAERDSYTKKAEDQGVAVLLLLLEDAQQGLRTQGYGSTSAAAAAGGHVTGHQQGQCTEGSGSTSAPAAAAAGGHVTDYDMGASSSVAGGPTLGAASSSGIPPAFLQKFGDLCGVFEAHLRGLNMPAQHGPGPAVKVAGLCCTAPDGQSKLLLRLAQQGTAEQQVAFFNLLVTLLKLPNFAFGGTDTRERARVMVATAAMGMLPVSQSCMHSSSTVSVTAADIMAASSSSSSSSSIRQGCNGRDRSAALWLLLMGRCCLQWAAELAKLPGQVIGGFTWASTIQMAQQSQDPFPFAGRMVQMPINPTLLCCFARSPQLLSFANSLTGACKEGSSISAGLTAAGYDMGPVLEAFEALAACYPDVTDARVPEDTAAGNVAGLISALEAVGRACSVFAVPHCCNNPRCSNVAGPSELFLVSGKSCICGGCRVARYCGRGCQKPHWKQHKAVCKMLQAATVENS